jgi:hypothetical protein
MKSWLGVHCYGIVIWRRPAGAFLGGRLKAGAELVALQQVVNVAPAAVLVAERALRRRCAARGIEEAPLIPDVAGECAPALKQLDTRG